MKQPDRTAKPLPSLPGTLGLLALQAGAFVVIGLTLWGFGGPSSASFVSFRPDEIALGLVLAAILAAVAFATFKGLPRLSEWLVRAQKDTYAFLLEKPLPLWAIVVVSLCAGIGEEALSRGGVQTLAANYMPVPLAIILASALFAIVHMAKPPIAAIIFAIGALFGTIYWQTESLLAVMIGHALYDVFALWYLQKEMHRLNVFAPEPME